MEAIRASGAKCSMRDLMDPCKHSFGKGMLQIIRDVKNCVKNGTSKYKINLNSFKGRARQYSIGKECYFTSEAIWK